MSNIVPHPPTLGLSMIIGGRAFAIGGHGATDLKLCLESIRDVKTDQIVIVDTGVVDPAALQVIEAESAFRQSEGLQAIEVYPFAWINDFAAARNHSLSFIKTDFWYWIDGDDVVENPEGVRRLIEGVQTSETSCFWLPYKYGFDQYGNVTVVHDRERIMRTKLGWKWNRELHEVCSQLSGKALFAMTTDVTIAHMRGGESHSSRNLPILLKMLERDPNDPRTVRDLANQYFSNGEWQKAIAHYEKHATLTKDAGPKRGMENWLERWSGLCYCGRSYRELGNIKDAIRCDMAAVMLGPRWKGGYLGLAQDYSWRGDWDSAAHWAEQAREREHPPRYLFVNPLESELLVCDVLIPAYAEAKEYDKAIAECERYLALRPDEERVKGQKSQIEELRRRKKAGEAFAATSAYLMDEEVIPLVKRMNGLRQEETVRNVVVPALLRRAERGTQPKVHFFCGPSFDEWWPGLPDSQGMGGSETAVIEIARQFAKDGWQAVVYNRCGDNEGEYEDVLYADYQRWRPEQKPDLLVSWRQAAIGIDPTLGASQKWLWCHNVLMGGLYPESAKGFDKVMALSPFHVKAMRDVYPFLTEAQMGIVPNGINIERFKLDPPPQRNLHKVVYFSSPDRGLKPLLMMWRDIVQQVKDAELHIYYGWENIDKAIQRGDPKLAEQKAEIMKLLIQPNVVWHGRIGQKELAKELLSAQVWAYPSSWFEEYCIAADEAMAAGLYIVTSDLGNLPHILGPVGVQVPVTRKMNQDSTKWRRRFTGMVFNGMLNPNEQGLFRESGPARAAEHSWEAAYGAWKAQIKTPVEV